MRSSRINKLSYQNQLPRLFPLIAPEPHCEVCGAPAVIRQLQIEFTLRLGAAKVQPIIVARAGLPLSFQPSRPPRMRRHRTASDHRPACCEALLNKSISAQRPVSGMICR
jgi:hypothetical protein